MNNLPLWRDIALVILAIQGILVCAVPLVVLYFTVKGMRILRTKIRHFAPRVRRVFRQVANGAERASRAFARPVNEINVREARLCGLWRGARRVMHR